MSASHTIDFNNIVNQLPRLSPPQLLQLKQKLNAALSFSGAPAIENYLLTGIKHELGRRGLATWLSPKLINQNALSQVSTFFESKMPDLPPVDKVALGRLCAHALAWWLDRKMVPITPRTLLSNVLNIPVAVEAAYPSYLVCGLLPSCWR